MVLRIDRGLCCVLCLSVSFLFLFAADFTTVNMQKILVSSIEDDRPGDFKVEGYTVTGLVYTVFSVTLWIAPCVNYALGPKITMLLSAFGYLCYVGSYALEEAWALYTAAVIGGVAAGILWPAQGQYLLQNSRPEVTARNIGIFWFILNNADMVGNLFVYFAFRGKTYINQGTRRAAVYYLIGVNILAVIGFASLPRSVYEIKKPDYGPLKTMKSSLYLWFTPRMMWLTLSFGYLGLQQSFWNGIYSTTLGFTLAFGDSVKELVALSGIFMGLGAVLGAVVPIIFSGWIRDSYFARRIIFSAGVFVQIITYLITFVNIPDNAVFGNTESTSLIQPSVVLAMLGSFLMCFGDAFMTTQAFSIVGDHYRENCVEAYALYKFVKGAMVAVSFYSCSHLGLHTQLIIMAVTGVLGAVAFYIADYDYQRPSDTTEEYPPEKQHVQAVKS